MSIGDPSLAADSLYQQKLTELLKRYSIQTELVCFGRNEFFFTKVIDPGEVPVDLDETGQLRWQPYWAEDWESSRALCRLLLDRDISGLSILDLGCGLGLTGAVAASRGAQVLLADNARPALEFSEVNCWHWNNNCEYRLVDWRNPSPELGQFDVIVGAEIIYDSDDWLHLERFWRRHLKSEGSVWLCDPYRQTGMEFREWIQHQNWIPVFTDFDVPEFEKPTNVIELSMSGS